eukprot:1594737-Prymnesium_polylepis.1
MPPPPAPPPTLLQPLAAALCSRAAEPTPHVGRRAVRPLVPQWRRSRLDGRDGVAGGGAGERRADADAEYDRGVR